MAKKFKKSQKKQRQSPEDRKKLDGFMNVFCAHVAQHHAQVIGGIVISF